MPLSVARWKEVRRVNFDKLVAFMDPYFAHFLSDDAEVAAEVLGLDLSSKLVDGHSHLVVDRRDWNPTVERLNAAGHQVCFTDAHVD